MNIDVFIQRWTAREGGAERANYQMFLSELCDVIGVARPDVAGADRKQNDYVFERGVRRRSSDDFASSLRIDLYKKGCFILEAKQSRWVGGEEKVSTKAGAESAPLGRRAAMRGWDVMMQQARKQAEQYVFLLDTDHPAPPFLITCDVGHVLELYADFSGTGRAYSQFPDRNRFQIHLEDLRDDEVRELLARIWTNPASLDPTRESARVTREIAKRLAEVSKALEAQGNNAEDVAQFLMRCLFTMFAEDVGLLPPESFKALLEKSVQDPSYFPHRLKALWQDMDAGKEFSHAVDARVRHFNGGLFRDTTVFVLGREEIGELLAAAKHKWTEVDPAIFGTLLEQALETSERRKLGAHYTPRAYVQRLVEVTIMEPLRADWEIALTRAQSAADDDDEKKAVAIVKAFHHQLCTTRVLDPACGTGNFLYVSLELMKKLEGDVLEALARLGVSGNLGLERETVDPHQFLGLELNPRAAAIAELVVWIGYLQQHYRNSTGHPAEPILRAFKNINYGRRDGYDAVLTWDGYPLPTVMEKDGKRAETYPNARRPDWPDAEFIVGNPPFIGGKDVRSRLGSAYAETLWRVHKPMNESADFVMYWWDRAAELLTRKDTPLRRFGLVTTNSITQVFQRRVTERHLNAKKPISLIFAIPDHPWTKATKDSAAVRIAMTVAEAGKQEGVLYEVVSESGLDTDEPAIAFRHQKGVIHSDLSTGVALVQAKPLMAATGLASRGVQLMGNGFIISRAEAAALGLGRESKLKNHIREYRNGRDLTATSRGSLVIDLFGLEKNYVRESFPAVYQHLTTRVRYDLNLAGQPRTDKYGRKLGREWNNRESYQKKWWIFGEPRKDFRPALEDLPRYIATVETAKHRVFQFLDASILPDNMIVAIALKDAVMLALLSSRIHTAWALNQGATLEDRPRYTKSGCFDPFPFPDIPAALHLQLSSYGEELDALRKRVLAEHPNLTLTGLYNVLEKLKAGEALNAKEEDVKTRGLVLIIKELHEEIDRLTAEAYGWPVDMADEQILERLVALNTERAREEAAGHVRWLRPDYQIPRFAKDVVAKSGDLELANNVVAIDAGKPAFPKDREDRAVAVLHLLEGRHVPMDAATIARQFKSGGKRIEPHVERALMTLERFGRVVKLSEQVYASYQGAVEREAA
jgi:hypothetical protein